MQPRGLGSGVGGKCCTVQSNHKWPVIESIVPTDEVRVKKLLKEELLGASRFMSTFMCWEGGAPSKDTEAMCPHPFLYAIDINPVRLFLSCVLSKKAFSVGLFLSFMSHFVNDQNWGGTGELLETVEFVAKSERIWGA